MKGCLGKMVGAEMQTFWGVSSLEDQTMMVWDVTSLGKGITFPLSAALLLQGCLLSWFLDLDNGAFEVCQACTGLRLPCLVGSLLQLSCLIYRQGTQEPGG